MYCIDTSSFIYMQSAYPIETFPSVWTNIGNIAKENEIISPRAVLKEIETRDDQVHNWIKQYITFQTLDTVQETIVSDIMSKYPSLVDINKSTEDADPFVIALAKNKGYIVVTQENRVNLSGSQSKYKIPNVCDAYKVESMPILDLFKEKKWQF